MSQYHFGSGVLFGTPLTDASGNAIANGTPVEFGALQDVSLDISFDTKMLYGPNQFPLDVARGKGKISGKAAFARVNGTLWNSLVFGQTLSAGIVADVYDTTGEVIPTTPFQITPSVPNAGTWSATLSVNNANGDPMQEVASAPATGQFSVAGGVYTFAAADVGLTVFINYQYTATSTTARKSTVVNLPMGYAPTFQCDFMTTHSGKQLLISLPKCISSKLSLATKLDDYMIPSFDFDAFATPTGTVLTYSTTEA